MGPTLNTTHNRNFEVLAIGELLWDVLPEGPVLGGAPANVAFRLHAQGVRVGLVSRVGNDELGQLAVQFLSSVGLDTSLIQIDHAHSTGTVPVTLNSEGNPSFTILPDVAYDYLEPADSLQRCAGTAKTFCFGTLIQRSEQARSTLYQILGSCPHAVKFLDINLRKNCYTPETIRSSLELATILKLNRSEVRELSSMFSLQKSDLEYFCDWVTDTFGLDMCIVTIGEDGAFGFQRGGQKCTAPGFKVEVQDSIGAGDAFSAGFIAAHCRHLPLEQCLINGNIWGALSASKKGGMGEITPQELASFIKNNSLQANS